MVNVKRSIAYRGISRRNVLVGAAAMALGSMTLASAQTPIRGYPNRLVRLIVPYSAGGPLGAIALPLAQKLSERWGQPVIVEYHPGASGSIGANAVAKSPPDGYMLLFCNVAEIAILPLTRADLPYDPLKDFAPVTLLVSGAVMLTVKPDQPFKTLQELVAYAKSEPNKLSYASQGTTGIAHITGEMLNARAGIKLVHVPYQGAGPGITDLLGGHVNMAFTGISVAAPLVISGKLRALAVSTATRSTLLPDVPAISEFYPGVDVNSWYGVIAAGGTPKDIVAQIYQDIATVVQQPDFAQSLRRRGSEIVASMPEQFAATIKDDLTRYASVLKAAGLAPK